MVRSFHFFNSLTSSLFFVFLYLFIKNYTFAQSFKLTDGFIESPLIYSYETNLKGISKVTPVGDHFSKYSSLELSLVKSLNIKQPSKWLEDKIYDVLGDIAETERILNSEDSPLADPIFKQFKHLPFFIEDTMEQLALNPLVFCKKINVLYNKAGKYYELNCTVPFGFFNNYLLMRLQNKNNVWYFTKINTLNYNRLIDFLVIADSFYVKD